MIQRKRILCITDIEEVCQILGTNFDTSDFDVISIMDIDEALELVKRERFDLYIVDFAQRDWLGERVCEELRARDKTTPLVILSGKRNQGDREAAISAGANAYVFKPDVDEFTRTTRQMLYGHGGISSVLLGD